MKKSRIILLILILSNAFISCSKYAQIKNETTYSELSYQDHDRSYLIHLPKDYDPKKQYPLVFVLHGITSQAEAIAGFSKFNTQADQKDFIVCYPQGYKRAWVVKSPTPDSQKNETDDLGFIDQLIDTIEFNYSVDSTKVFACGISNGGYMAALLASKLPNHFAGIALVCSNLFNPLEDYASEGEPVPLLLIGSEDDPLVKYEGGKAKKKGKYVTVGFKAAIDYWVTKNNCAYPKDSLIIENVPDDKTTVIKYYAADETSKNRVVHYKIIGGGHGWPGRKKDFKSIFLGKISQEINAAEIITDFFLGSENLTSH